MGIFSQLSNDITYPLIGSGAGLLLGALLGSQTKMSHGAMIGAIGGALGGGALGYAIAQKGSSGGAGTISLSSASTTIGTGLFGGNSYTPSSTNITGSGFSGVASNITIYYVSAANYPTSGSILATIGSATTGVAGLLGSGSNFANLGLGGVSGPIQFSYFNPVAGTGYIIAYNPTTGLYSNAVKLTVVPASTSGSGSGSGTATVAKALGGQTNPFNLFNSNGSVNWQGLGYYLNPVTGVIALLTDVADLTNFVNTAGNVSIGPVVNPVTSLPGGGYSTTTTTSTTTSGNPPPTTNPGLLASISVPTATPSGAITFVSVAPTVVHKSNLNSPITMMGNNFPSTGTVTFTANYGNTPTVARTPLSATATLSGGAFTNIWQYNGNGTGTLNTMIYNAPPSGYITITATCGNYVASAFFQVTN